jgi:predicted phage terminase large subunit-like protein
MLKKVVRIRRLTPYLAKRQIRFKAGSKGARLLVEQLRDFPNGDHDDGPDALDQAVQLGREVWGPQWEPVSEILWA